MIHTLDPSISIFDSLADVLVNPVNCLCASKSGMTSQFASRFPENQMRLMEKRDLLGKLVPGNVYWFKPPQFPLIANMTIREHWRGNPKMEWIEAGLYTLRDMVDVGIMSVAIPYLGDESYKLVLKIFNDQPYDVATWGGVL